MNNGKNYSQNQQTDFSVIDSTTNNTIIGSNLNNIINQQNQKYIQNKTNQQILNNSYNAINTNTNFQSNQQNSQINQHQQNNTSNTHLNHNTVSQSANLLSPQTNINTQNHNYLNTANPNSFYNPKQSNLINYNANINNISNNPNPINININLASQKNITQKIDVQGEILEITPLGSGSEVGRSCVVMRFRGKNIMFDCGIHPAYNGLGSLPYFDEIEPELIDVLLITHFHLDHCGALPYFLEKTGFKGDCFMTHPTKAIYKLTLADYLKVSHVNTDESLYEERDLVKSFEKIKIIDYHQEIISHGVKFWAYNAGHVLGAAMFLVEIEGIRVLYTGDFSREIDRHLKPAEIPANFDVNILIIESTYGVHKHEERGRRENDFKRYVYEIVKRGGKCLLPVFAAGRAQELLLIIDEYWEHNPDIQDVPIYYASSLASNYLDIFKTYINMTGDYVKNKFYEEGINPFKFKHINCVKTIEYLDESKPAVVFASPGMLQSGLSRNLFEKWCENSQNGVIITGYSVEGTLAKYILGEPNEIKLSNGNNVPLKMAVKNVTFSAHSDFYHTSDFIEKMKPQNIVLVHGEGKEMERLRNELERLKVDNKHFKEFKPRIFNPKNCQKIEFYFKIQRNSYVVGNLSKKILENLNWIYNIKINSKIAYENLNSKKNNLLCKFDKYANNNNDLLALDEEHKMENSTIYKSNNLSKIDNSEYDIINEINNDIDRITYSKNEEINKKLFSEGKPVNLNANKDEEEYEENYIECRGLLLENENLILDKSDIKEYSAIQNMNKFKQILKVNFTQCKSMLLYILKDYYEDIIEFEKFKFCINDNIYVYFQLNNIVLEWYSNSKNDLVADSIALLIYQVENHPNNQTFSHYSSKENICSYKLKSFISYLKTKYETVEMEKDDLIQVKDEGLLCYIELNAEKFKVRRNDAVKNAEFEEKLKDDISYFEIL